MPSISQLPNELLEFIFDHLHDKTAEPNIASQKTFASLARTAKLFLPLARSYLYYRPISPSTSVLWESALELSAALSTSLGNLVVSLQGIVDYVVKIGELDEPSYWLSFQLAGYTKTFSLYYKILSSCPRVTFVEILCNSTRHLSKLLAALQLSIPTLNTIKFANSRFSNEYRIATDIVYEALKRLRHGSVDEVILDCVGSSTLSGNPRGLIALRSFSVRIVYYRNQDYEPLFPRDTSLLSSFSLETGMFVDSDLIWILEYLPSTLRQLTLNADLYESKYIQFLGHYQRRVLHSLPLSKLSRFTSLEELSLKSFRGPSLALLDTLKSSSPNISVLVFKNSYWVNPSSSISTSFPIIDDSIPSLLDTDALLSHLLVFQKLKRVHLGYLPTRKTETFRKLEEEMEEKRSVKVEWQVCE
ncbi:hypothetical protein JCM5350_005540 [Sporobolomyces pararoseus]